MKWPERYFTGLTPSQRKMRQRELVLRRTTPRLRFTDTLVKTKPSKWTARFHEVYPDLPFNKNKISARTGIPRHILNTVYDRGLKAWQTSGSRVGANPQQWAIARVYKFVLVTKKKFPTTRVDPDSNLRQ